jgi:transposase
LNANLLRRWISQYRLPAKPATVKRTKTLAVAPQTQFIPLELQANEAPANIQIELQRGATLVRVQWPLGYAGGCAAWMREVLK